MKAERADVEALKEEFHRSLVDGKTLVPLVQGR